MNVILQITRFFVGILFIFSGLVKANDPLGLSYKMQEFFEIWGWGSLNHLTLALSILMIAFEIVAGAALILGWKFKLVSWLLLLLIVFFTFLTGYAFLSGKFKNCGCFGDCLPISPLTSFLKDVLLLILIIFLLYHRRKIKPLFSPRANGAWVFLFTVFSFLFQYYVLEFLPVVDCLPLKKGNRIADQLKPPPGSVTDSFAIRFIYEKNGQRYEFSPTELPADFKTYKFVERIDKQVRKGNAEPPLKGFSLKGSTGEDSTDIILNMPKVVLVFITDLSKISEKETGKLAGLARESWRKNVPFYLVTGSVENTIKKFREAGLEGVPVFNFDFTALRTAARSNPTLYLLNQGTVENKWSLRTSFGLSYHLGLMRPLPPLLQESDERIEDTGQYQTDSIQIP